MLSKNVTAISNREDDTWRRGAGGRKKERKYTTMCIFTSACTQTHTYTYTNTLERHGAVVSWQTNDRQMTCWNTSTRPDSNRPVRLCQWHLLWREGERGERERERVSEACVSFYTNKTSAKHRMWLLPPLSTVSNLICLSIWVAGSEDMVKGGVMERWNGKEGEKRWICCIGQRIWHLNCGSMLTCMLPIKPISRFLLFSHQLSTSIYKAKQMF